jgi:sugar transferase (PEP-CTERM/EpsH1 system associated)
MVRVMHVVHALRPGGMEAGVVKIVNGLPRGRVQSAICSTQPAGALKDLVNPDVRLYELNRRDGNDPSLVWNLFRLFRREQPDIVHTHAWGTLLEGLVAARFARVPVVIHGEHGTLQLRPRQRWAQRFAWAAADRVLSVSSRLADRMARETGFPRERIRVIRNGVDLTRFGSVDHSAARAALGLSGTSRSVVTVGRLVPVKDHATLLQAFARVHRDDPAAVVVVAGDGPLREPLAARAAALGVDHCVRFLGHRPDVELVLAAADVFVLSSESEGLSNTILEAMASGLPIVATRVGGADELVLDGETGQLVAPHSPSELAQALARLLGDPMLRRSMGAAGRARVEAEFSLAGMVGRYESLYMEAAATKRAREFQYRPARARAERSGVV